MTDEDLWGELPNPDPIKSPITILKEQGAILNRKTSGILDAEIGTSRMAGTKKIIAHMSIIAPLLDRYRLHVLNIEYDPVMIFPSTYTDAVNGARYEVHTDNGLLEVLKTTLQSESVKTAIARLLAASKAEVEES